MKDIRRGNQRNGGQRRGNLKVINMVNAGGSRKRPYETGRPILKEEITFPPIPQNNLTDGPIILEYWKGQLKNFDASIRSRLRKFKSLLVGLSGETYYPLGLVDLKVTMGEPGRSKTVLLEFAIVKCCSPHNAIMGRTDMRSDVSLMGRTGMRSDVSLC
ncbi:hypothetical protein Tco_1519967, partial [Tanacetum coccineum]